MSAKLQGAELRAWAIQNRETVLLENGDEFDGSAHAQIGLSPEPALIEAPEPGPVPLPVDPSIERMGFLASQLALCQQRLDEFSARMDAMGKELSLCKSRKPVAVSKVTYDGQDRIVGIETSHKE